MVQTNPLGVVAVLKDDRGQLILIACAVVAISMILMATYEYTVMGAGQGVIRNEVRGAAYYYMSGRDVYLYFNATDSGNMSRYERDIKILAAHHGYSFDFLHNGTIVFADKDMIIKFINGSV